MGGAGGTPAGDGWEAVIGLEVHVQLRTATKLFCACRATYGEPPNTHVCPVCLGLPGALPVANDRAVQLAVRAALALGCEVHPRSVFERKNYFYPDLPKGYQITQYDRPLATGGVLPVRLDEGEVRIRIRRLHLEEDAGKSLHDRFPGETAVDLNRAGVPLAEIVTEPDVRSPAAARAVLLRLKQVLEHYARVSDCNLEEGSLRVDANLSVRPSGSERPGTKAEIKNLNSFAFVEKALAHERERQIRRLREGRQVVPETRLYDPARDETRPLRGKEEAFDYRYFPEPDLPPLEVEAGRIRDAREALGRLPHQVEAALVTRHGLPLRDAVHLAARPDRAAYFEAAATGADPGLSKTVANLLMGSVAAELNRRSPGTREDDLFPPAALRRVAELRAEGTLSSDTAARAVELLAGRGEGEGRAEGDLDLEAAAEVDGLVGEHGLAQVADPDRLEAWVEEALRGQPDEVARWAAGEEKLVGFLMGAVMRASGGRADPGAARAALLRGLERAAAEERGGAAGRRG